MLTQKQRDLLEFIHRRMAQDGVPPSFDEMKDALDLRSKSGIHRLVSALEERGFIRRLAHRARAIEIIRLPEEFSSGEASTIAAPANENSVPVMGRIAAGVPIAAISEVSHHVSIPPEMIAGASPYALEVKGDSMIGLGILDGDTVILEQCDTADDGAVVVALVDDEEATLKTLRRNDHEVILEAANPAYPPRHLERDRVRIQGRLKGLLRSY